jgi:hypothetical protein
MNSAASLLDPASSPVSYVVSVLNLYGELPDTPPRTNPHDQRHARSWFDRGVPLSVVEAALLLASLRRIRPPGATPLPRIRSLAYFQPVIEELIENPVPEGYVQYLRVKLRSILDKANPADIQNSTFSRDR